MYVCMYVWGGPIDGTSKHKHRLHMSGCQNYVPFLHPYYNTAPNSRVPKEGAIILTTTHMWMRCGPAWHRIAIQRL